METLLFIDVTTPQPYHPGNFPGCGGTEQTVVQVAEGLAATGLFNVVVEQHNRVKGNEYRGHAIYAAPGYTTAAKWVVVLRNPTTMVSVRTRFKNAKIYLWSHDLADRNLGLAFKSGFFAQSGCLANICVSGWHKQQTLNTLQSFGYNGQFRNRFIYNPIEIHDISPSKTYDKNKLIWLASPHKGLARAFELLKPLLSFNSDFRLYVANPGYMEDAYALDPIVKNHTITLGTLSHEKALHHLRDSLCLFYPNYVFAETFGKIMAESNAVGTPVLTHRLGAASEVLDSHPGQLADCLDNKTVIDRIMKWYRGERPIVRGRSEFKLIRIIEEWKKLLYDKR